MNEMEGIKLGDRVIRMNQSGLQVKDIIPELQRSNRFSRPILDFFDLEVIKKSNSYFKAQKYSKFWSEATKKLRNVINYKRTGREGDWQKWDMRELRELLQWTLDMPKEKAGAALKQNMLLKFEQFIDGDLFYITKILKRGLGLSEQFQKNIQTEMKTHIINHIQHTITHLDLGTSSYNSIIFTSKGLFFIRHTGEINLKIHAKQTGILLNSPITMKNLPTEGIIALADIITEMNSLDFVKFFKYLGEVGDDCQINFIQINELEPKIIGVLSEKKTIEIKKAVNEVNIQKPFSNSEVLRQQIRDIFVEERTFAFTNDSSGFVKQAISYLEKLNMWIAIENTIHAGGRTKEVREQIRIAFLGMTTLKHSSVNNKIIGLDIKLWINSLKGVNVDRYGIKLIFNFEELKGRGTSLLSHGKKSFLDRFDPRTSNTQENTPDRWEGIIYEKIGNPKKTNKYTFRLKPNIADKKRILELKIIERLEKTAERSLKELQLIFRNNPTFKALWKKFGYKTYKELLESQVRPEKDPLQKLKTIDVRFDVVDGKTILADRYYDFLSHEGDLSAFKKAFVNKFLIDTACKSEKLLSLEIKGSSSSNAYQYLSKKTKKEIPIPRLSRSTNKLFYAELTNETYNSAPIRVFLDLITRSRVGHLLLSKIGMISNESFAMFNNSVPTMSFTTDWKTGISPSSLTSQVCGALDGIVTTTDGKKYLDEFIIEMVGNNKGNRHVLHNNSPFNSVIADLLRIACYDAIGKPGIVVYPHFSKSGVLIFTIIKFDEKVRKRLKKAGASIAVDINRPRVRKLLFDNENAIINHLREVFKLTKDMKLGSNLLRYSRDSISSDDLWYQFLALINIILTESDEEDDA
jgi:hypothetical protein